VGGEATVIVERQRVRPEACGHDPSQRTWVVHSFFGAQIWGVHTYNPFLDERRRLPAFRGGDQVGGAQPVVLSPTAPVVVRLEQRVEFGRRPGRRAGKYVPRRLCRRRIEKRSDRESGGGHAGSEKSASSGHHRVLPPVDPRAGTRGSCRCCSRSCVMTRVLLSARAGMAATFSHLIRDPPWGASREFGQC